MERSSAETYPYTVLTRRLTVGESQEMIRWCFANCVDKASYNVGIEYALVCTKMRWTAKLSRMTKNPQTFYGVAREPRSDFLRFKSNEDATLFAVRWK